MKVRHAWSVALVLALGGCAEGDRERAGQPGAGPGSNGWADEDVSCAVEADCGEGETCEDGVCQPKRCYEAYESLAPLGDYHYFGVDGEIAIVSDVTYVDGFESDDGAYMQSWDLGGEQVVDIAGGNLNGERPHGIAVAMEFSSKVLLNQSDGVSEIDVGIWPVAIATGDVDADGRDELVAFAEDGSIALCDAKLGSCTHASIEGAQGKDVAVADVDRDGRAEPVFLFDLNGASDVVIWNTDAATTGQEESYGWEFNIAPRAMAAGDLDGDLAAEVVLLEDGGWWNWADDKVHVFSPTQEAILGTKGVDGHTKDVAVGDRNSDEKAEVAILRDDHKVQLFASTAPGTLESVLVSDITVGDTQTRMAMLDWDGDSASGRLTSGPELVAGRTVPTTVLLFPPYREDIADGVANVIVGDGQSMDESVSETVSLGVGIMVGFGLETPILEAKVSASLERGIELTHRVTRQLYVSQKFWVDADPDRLGSDYAAVVLSCGCYHRYRYVTDDPAGRIGGSGQTVEMLLPVGGQTILWSSKRYNAMAKAVGTLPIIEVPYRIGDPGSYPTAPQTLDGAPIPEIDMLFPALPSFQVSDIADTGFWFSAAQFETNEVCESIELGVSGSLGAGGVEVELSAKQGWSTGYSITAGTEVTFAGEVPSIPDDPETPEDEFELYRYAFSPYVYRQHYTDPAGQDAGYYVLTYSVGK
jgi:hypothetical protein